MRCCFRCSTDLQIGLGLESIVQIASLGEETKLWHLALPFDLVTRSVELGLDPSTLHDVHSSRESLQRSITCPDRTEICRRCSPMNRREDRQSHGKCFQMPLIEEDCRHSCIATTNNSPSTSEVTKNRRRVSSSVSFVFCQKYRI